VKDVYIAGRKVVADGKVTMLDHHDGDDAEARLLRTAAPTKSRRWRCGRVEWYDR
jgi:hypothetical protein